LDPINQIVPADGRALVVGEARTFYALAPVDYAVVFSPQPLVEAAQRYPDDAGLLGWLQRRGYTHVLVNVSEVRRLERDYDLDRRVMLAVRRLYQLNLPLLGVPPSMSLRTTPGGRQVGWIAWEVPRPGPATRPGGTDVVWWPRGRAGLPRGHGACDGREALGRQLWSPLLLGEG